MHVYSYILKRYACIVHNLLLFLVSWFYMNSYEIIKQDNITEEGCNIHLLKLIRDKTKIRPSWDSYKIAANKEVIRCMECGVA